MYDKFEKTNELLGLMNAALPFEVVLTPELIVLLARQTQPITVGATETVSEVSYAGGEGGIMCHIHPAAGGERVVVSLTHLRVPRTLPFAAKAVEYQRHRLKKLKKRRETPVQDVPQHGGLASKLPPKT